MSVTASALWTKGPTKPIEITHNSSGYSVYMFWAVRGHRPPAGGILAMPLAGTYEMPTGGIGTWYAPRGHTRIADKDAKLL